MKERESVSIPTKRESKPVLDFYDKKILHHIDAGQAPVKVLFDILGHIVKL